MMGVGRGVCGEAMRGSLEKASDAELDEPSGADILGQRRRAMAGGAPHSVARGLLIHFSHVVVDWQV